MNILSAFQEIMNPDVILPICTGDNFLTLKEDEKDSKIKILRIQGVPEDAFAFTLDYKPRRNQRWFQQLSCYVNKTNKSINKSCDLILVMPSNLRILIFDLKSNRTPKEDIEKQLLNSELYVRYLLSMVEAYYQIDTSHFKFKRTVVTTRLKPPNLMPSKKSSYAPDDAKTFSEVSVQPLPGEEAYVHLNPHSALQIVTLKVTGESRD